MLRATIASAAKQLGVIASVAKQSRTFATRILEAAKKNKPSPLAGEGGRRPGEGAFHAFRFLSVLLLSLSLGTTAHAYPSHNIALPNGEYIETTEDLKVKAIGGHITAKRVWTNSRWYLNPEWADLKFVAYDPLDGSVKDIDRAGAIYERSGAVWMRGINNSIVQRDGGWRWGKQDGPWVTYDAQGRITAAGDRSGTHATIQYNGQGQRSRVLDAKGNLALSFTYNSEGLLQTVADRTGRQVTYTYTNQRLTQVTDVMGNDWHYTYDSQGQIQTRTDPEGHQIHLFYVDNNPAGNWNGTGFTAFQQLPRNTSGVYTTAKTVRDVRTAKVGTYTDPENNVTTYQYQYNRNSRQYTVTQISPEGVRTTNVYDRDGRNLQSQIGTLKTRSVVRESKTQETITDARGLNTRITYDGFRNILRTVHPDGSSTSTTYNAHHQPLTQTDEMGIVTQYEYDQRGNLTRLTEARGYPEQRITEHQYDQYGQRTRTTLKGDTAADDIVTQWKYDDYGNMIEETNAEGHTTKYTHDVMGNVLTIQNARGFVSVFEHNVSGELIKQTDAKGTAEEAEKSAIYDKVGNRIKYIDSRGNATLYVYDKNNRPTEMIDPEGGVSKIIYDKDGRITKKTDPDMVVQLFEYGQQKALSTVKDAENNTIRFIYGEADSGLDGLLVKTVFPTYSEEYRYDNHGRRVQVRRKINELTEEVTAVSYDAQGNLIEETDAIGRMTKTTYDPLRRKKEALDPINGLTKFEYDKADNLLKFTDPKGTVTQYQYDKTGRKTQEFYSSKSRISYVYDSIGNLVEVKSASGKKLTHTYNALNRLTKEEHFFPGQANSAQTISYSYDANGNLTGYEDKDDKGNVVTAAYSYDKSNRKTSQMVNYGAFQKTHRFSYTAAGRRLQRIDPDNISETVLWDEAGRVREIKLGESSLLVSDYEWKQPRSLTWPNNVKQEYTYDSLQRVKTIKLSKAEDELMRREYLYDLAGNVTSLVKDDESRTYGYDAIDRLVVVSSSKGNNESYTYDAVNNRLKDHAQSVYTYNAKHQLEKIENQRGEEIKSFLYDEDGHTTREVGEEFIRSFYYGASGRLSEVKQDGVTVASYKYDPFGRRVKKDIDGVVTWFSYDDTGLIAEYTESGEQVAAYSYWPDQPWQTNPIYKRIGTDGLTYHYFHNDHLGTPQRLTDSEGAISWRGVYESFGRVHEDINTTPNPLRFPGQYQDNETGLYQNYYRDYAPALGRYIQSDPIGLDGGVNRYAYVAANPLKSIDPQGLIRWTGGGGGASGSIGGGIDIYNLTSECACRKQVNAEVMAVYGTASAIPIPVPSAAGGDACFEDSARCPDASNLSGLYLKAYAGGAIGRGYYYGFILLGKAISCGRGGRYYGLDLGGATFAVGYSFILRSNEECCFSGLSDLTRGILQ